MTTSSPRVRRGVAALLYLVLFAVTAACDGDGEPSADAAPVTDLWTLASVVIKPDDSRTTYLQTLTSLDIAQITNQTAIEIEGNGTIQTADGKVFVGLAEAPTVVRYAPDASGRLVEDGRISFLNEGLARAGFGNVIASPTRAYMLSESQFAAIIWDPSALEIVGRIDLADLRKEGLEPEFWTATHHQGRVYVPVRYANWNAGVIDRSVTLVVIDVATDRVIATLRDDRCHSGGRPVFASNGDAYVLADGRSWSAQLFATAAGTQVPPTCLLRIPAGTTAFDPSYLVEIAGLTGGHDAAGELETTVNGTGIAFAKMFHKDRLPPGVEIKTDFAFWQAPAFKLWKLELGAAPTAVEVADLPFGALAWEGTVADGKLYVGESPDYSRSTVYEIDPATGRAARRFEMEGSFYGLRRLR